MSILIVLDGDSGPHGGTVIATPVKAEAEGKKIVRNGDTYQCPTHGDNPIVTPGTTKSWAEGKLIAVNGAQANCGATMTASAVKAYAT
jgi:uncharacterized Zn-binding protein involved in type VI secretion